MMHRNHALRFFVGLCLVSVLFTFDAERVFAQHRSQGEWTEGFDRESAWEIEKARRKIKKLFSDAVDPDSLTEQQKAEILEKYHGIDPMKFVPTDLLEQALLYFDVNKGKFSNRSHLIVIDFKPRSDQYRFFLINLIDGSVERFRTTHGRGSDLDKDGHAEAFSNVVGSGSSSLGYVRTAEVYWGKYKRSVRLDGLSPTNSNLRKRAVVLHGWKDMQEAPIIQPLSWGCPALDWSLKDAVIDKVKDGSLMLIGVSKEIEEL